MDGYVILYMVGAIATPVFGLAISFRKTGLAGYARALERQMVIELDAAARASVVERITRVWRAGAIGGTVGAILSTAVVVIAAPIESSIALGAVVLAAMLGGLLGSFIAIVRPRITLGSVEKRTLGDFVAPPFTALMHVALVLPVTVVVLFVVLVSREPLDFSYGYIDPPKVHFPLVSVVFSIAALVVYLWFQVAGRIVARNPGQFETTWQRRTEDLITKGWLFGVGGLFFWACYPAAHGFSELDLVTTDHPYRDAAFGAYLGATVLVVLIPIAALLFGYKHARTRTHMEDRLWPDFVRPEPKKAEVNPLAAKISQLAAEREALPADE